MSFTTPQELIEAFFRTFNAGDLDATLALYEPNAVLVAEPGKTVQGTAALREALGAFLGMKPKLTPDKSEMLTTGDLALSLVKWTLNGAVVAGGGSWGGVCAGASATERQRSDSSSQKNLIPAILHSFRAERICCVPEIGHKSS